MADESDTGKPLTLQSLGTDQATATLGILATKHLALHGVVSFYSMPDGTIQLALPGEVSLDGIPETMALQTLQDMGYTDEAMVEYLKGRDARMGRV